VLTPLRDFAHQRFVTHKCAVGAIKLWKKFREYCHAFTSIRTGPAAIGVLDYRSVGKIPMAFTKGKRLSAWSGKVPIGV
jgi:hypothetical protein